MANTLKDIRKRISSVRNTQKITRAMKMVAASKLRRSQQALVAARPYANHMAALINQLAAAESEHPQHPLLVPRKHCPSEQSEREGEAPAALPTGGGDASPYNVKRARLVLLTSDRGFCGGFNGNLLRRVLDWLVENKERYEKVEIKVIGKKGRDFFRARGIEVADVETGVYEDFDFGRARARAEQVIAGYENENFDECFFVYNCFKSAISQEITFQKLVPIEAEGHVEEEATETYLPDFIYEPVAPKLLGELIPHYIATIIFRMFLESIASEFGARMVAMDAATNNCSDMIDKLTLTGNRLRQAAITNELMDIVNGAEAL